MKFCGKCGKELNGNRAFCTNCGAKAETAANNPLRMGVQSNSDVGGSTTMMLQSVQQTGIGRLKQLGENMNLFITMACLLILSFIFTFVPIIYESATLFVRVSESYSLSYMLSESGLGFLTVAGVLLMIISAIFLFLPLLTNGKHTTKSFIFAKIWSIYSLALGLLMMLVSIIGGTQVARDWGNIVSIGVTFGGYLFLLINIALIITTYKLSSKFKAS